MPHPNYMHSCAIMYALTQAENEAESSLNTLNIDGEEAHISFAQLLASCSTISESAACQLSENVASIIPKHSHNFIKNGAYLENLIAKYKNCNDYTAFHKHKTFFGHALINDDGFEPTLIGCLCVSKDGRLLITGSDDWYSSN